MALRDQEMARFAELSGGGEEEARLKEQTDRQTKDKKTDKSRNSERRNDSHK